MEMRPDKTVLQILIRGEGGWQKIVDWKVQEIICKTSTIIEIYTNAVTVYLNSTLEKYLLRLFYDCRHYTTKKEGSSTYMYIKTKKRRPVDYMFEP